MSNVLSLNRLSLFPKELAKWKWLQEMCVPYWFCDPTLPVAVSHVFDAGKRGASPEYHEGAIPVTQYRIAKACVRIQKLWESPRSIPLLYHSLRVALFIIKGIYDDVNDSLNPCTEESLYISSAWFIYVSKSLGVTPYSLSSSAVTYGKIPEKEMVDLWEPYVRQARQEETYLQIMRNRMGDGYNYGDSE